MKIAIDGPAGAGKSTIAKAIAAEYKLLYLDTGAMYRACALKAKRLAVDVRDEEAVAELMKDFKLGTMVKDGSIVMSLDGVELGPEIRTEEISKLASDISARPSCRQGLRQLQRDLAEEYDVIMDGRDIGTVVLPNAEVKIFLTASVEERARRRFLEQQSKGLAVNYADVEADIRYRDKQDTERPIDPLRQAEDAILVDSDKMNIEQVLVEVRKLVNKDK